MDLDLSLIRLDLLLHFVVLDYQELGLFGLVLKLSCKLVILEDCQPRGGLKLLIV